MNIYYIDFENVSSLGLKGVDQLTENDEIYLLYSKKADNMKIDALTDLLRSRARISFLPVHVGTPNALDFQLVTLLYLHYDNSNRYFIISKDSGYDCCIRTGLENGAPHVQRFPDIESALRLQTEHATDEERLKAAEHACPARGGRRGRRPSARPEKNQSAAAFTGETEEVSLPLPEEESPAQEASLPEAPGHIQEESQKPEDSRRNAHEVRPSAGQDAVTPHAGDGQMALEQKADSSAGFPADAGQGSSPQKHSRRRRRSSRSGRGSQQSPAAEEAGAAVPGEHESAAPAPSEEAAPVSDTRSPASWQEAEVHDDSVQSVASDDQENVSASGSSGQGLPLEAPAAEDLSSESTGPGASDISAADSGDVSPEPSDPLSERIRQTVQHRCGFTPDERQTEVIIGAMQKSSNKQQFYKYFVRQLGQKDGLELYHSIRSCYGDFLAVTSSASD